MKQVKVNNYKKNRNYINFRYITIWDLGYLSLVAGVFLGLAYLTITFFINPPEITKDAYAKMAIPTTTFTPTPTIDLFEEVKSTEEIRREHIEKEIKEVFGEHSNDAFLLLSCENEELDPEAVNTFGNEPVGSADVGVFQINDHWQKVGNRAFLTDYKINIRMAWNIYSRDGYSFKLWTCGRKLGI